MTDGTGDKIRGTVEEKKGEVKQAVGDATGDDRLKGEGMLDEAKGKAEKFLGDIKDKVEDIGDDAERRAKSS
ncbi:MAG: CsbD family protein [Chloroflexota bacterium]|nr:CsbD family protein [Chloroflexota bacterium]